MCGIFGVLGAVQEPAFLLERMAASLRHRGPDDEGVWHEPGFGFGNRRLSIVDLAHGRQPLWNETGEVGLVCNGEIYNSDELRASLEPKHSFRTRTDVEVILHLYEDEGPEMLSRLEGMFALALWDRVRGRLLLARDRAGEKPLFYAQHHGVLYFASELRALFAAGPLSAEPSAVGLERYLTLGYFPAPDTPYAQVRKLAPGHRLLLTAGEQAGEGEPWWSLRPLAAAGARNPERVSFNDAAVTLRQLFAHSVTKQLMGEVPVGVALSGGIDSAWIARIARESGPLHTFTLAFEDPSFDESDAAGDLARRLATTHHRVNVGTRELMRAVTILGERMDEPLGDPAVLPTYLLAEAAVRDVKVLLGGEGADELFGGYPTYLGHRAVTLYRRVPRFLREGWLAPWIASWPASSKKVSLDFLLKRFVEAADQPALRRHALWFGLLPPQRARAMLATAAPRVNPDAVFERLLGDPLDFGGDLLPALLYLDFVTYLGEGLLTKLDRASMLASLECRAPYLSAPLVEMAARLPISYKVRGLTTKRVLRAAAARDLPAEWLRRRKRGLSVPLARLFREELAGWLESELDPKRVEREGLLRSSEVDRLRREHADGHVDRSRALWGVLSLVRWHRRGVIAPAPMCEPSLVAKGAR